MTKIDSILNKISKRLDQKDLSPAISYGVVSVAGLGLYFLLKREKTGGGIGGGNGGGSGGGNGGGIKPVLVVIDPGHGGSDPGAIGPSGHKESDINLAISKRLQASLQKLGLSTKMTRDSNVYVSLSQRAEIANKLKAAAFVSIHCNAVDDRKAKGMEVYHYYLSYDGGVKLAESIHAELVKAIPEVFDRGVKGADYAVLRLTKMPAALVETAFISNPEEEKLLINPAFQERVANGISQGIKNYIG